MAFDFGNTGGTWSSPGTNTLQSAWQKRYGNPDIAAAGYDPTKASDVQNYQLQNQRNLGVSNYVNSMADPNAAPTANMFLGDYAGARSGLNDYLKTSPSDLPNPFASQVTDNQSRIASLLDNPDSIQNSAAYKFRFDQGLDALNRQLGAKGLLNSGNRLTATTDYAQGQAAQEYGDQFKRLSDLYGTNANAYIGDQNANTSAWNAKGGLLKDYYGTASGNVNQNAELNNNNRLGWANQYSKIAPQPQSWSIANSW